MQFSIMQTEIQDQISVLPTSTFITVTMIKRWLNMGKDWALSYKPWPFLESTGTDLIDATGNYPYPTLMKTKSAFLITVAGNRFEKIRYEDYLDYLEQDSAGDDKVWAEFGRTIYINGNACTVDDAVIIYGQKIVADLSADTETTPFASAEPSGDEAIVLRALSKALSKMEGFEVKAKSKQQEATEVLDRIWDRIVEMKPREVLKTTPRFRKINIINGIREDTNPNKIGKFNY